jgi:hypothetical protein
MRPTIAAALIAVTACTASPEVQVREVNGTKFTVATPRKVQARVMPHRGLFHFILGALNVGTNVNTSNDGSYPESETDIFIDPTNPSHLIAGSNFLGSNGQMFAFESTNSGGTWTKKFLPLPAASPPINFSADPAVAIDRHGKLYYAYIALNYASGLSSAGLWVLSGNDLNALSNATPVKIPSATASDKEFLAVDLDPASPCVDTVYVAWDNNGGGQNVMVSHSVGGTTWSTVGPIQGYSGAGAIGSYPLVGPGGLLSVAWARYDTQTIYIKSSNDCGKTFGTRYTIDTWGLQTGGGLAAVIPADPYRGVSAFPEAAVDMSSGSHRGRIYVAHTDQGSGSCPATFTTANPQTGQTFTTSINFHTDVVMQYSDDAGATWSTPARVSDDGASACNDHFMPRTAVDTSDGSVYVSFYDTRADSTRKKADYYLARSTDGGQTWTNVKITSVQSDESRTLCTGAGGNCSDFNGYGDYSAIAASNGVIYPFWTDSRNASNGDEDVYSAKVTVSGGNPVSITTASLPSATGGAAYSTTLAATGGSAPYTWTVTGLPGTLSVAPATGVISGTPTNAEAGNYTAAVVVTDSLAATASKSLPLTVVASGGPLTIGTTSLPDGTAGTAYSTTLFGSGGTPPYNWAVTGMPGSLGVNAGTGAINGTPGTADVGGYTVNVTLTDSASGTASKQLALNINGTAGGPTITTATLPDGNVNQAYTATLAGSGGKTPYTWAAFGLPGGLGINAGSGVITGTPTAGGDSSVKISLYDSSGAVANRTFNLHVNGGGGSDGGGGGSDGGGGGGDGGLVCGSGTHLSGGKCVPDSQTPAPTPCGCGDPVSTGIMSLLGLALASRKRR